LHGAGIPRALEGRHAERGSAMKKIRVKKVEKILATATAIEYGL
jgi:hypothetical protein